MSFYWPAKPILTSVNIILQVNKNSYSLLQKSVIVYYPVQDFNLSWDHPVQDFNLSWDHPVQDFNLSWDHPVHILDIWKKEKYNYHLCITNTQNVLVPVYSTKQNS